MHPDPELLALLALGEDVGASDRLHVAGCAECTREVSELSQLVGLGRTVGAAPELEAPPARVWDRTAAELGLSTHPTAFTSPAARLAARPADSPVVAEPAATNGPDGPGPVPDPTPRTPSRRRGLAALVLAAVVALIAGFALGNVVDLPDRAVTLRCTELAPLPSWPGSSGSACAKQLPDGSRYLEITMATDDTVDGSREVWLINSDVTDMRALGYLNGSTARFAIPDGLDLAAYPIVDVSREPFDDPDPAHSSNSIIRGTLAG